MSSPMNFTYLPLAVFHRLFASFAETTICASAGNDVIDVLTTEDIENMTLESRM